MIQTKDLTIDNIKFRLLPLPAIKALKLDKTIVSLILPVLGGVDDFSLDAEIDLTKALTALSTSLTNMDEHIFLNLVKEMLSTTICMKENSAPIEIETDEDINNVFAGSITTVYKLIWEVMKFNNFSPFVVAGGGSGIAKIFSSKKENTEIVKNGNESETLADSTGN